MFICDSQVHIWAEETRDRLWTPGGQELVRDMGHRPKPIGYEELKELMDEAGVDRALIVPPTWDMDRNDLGLEAATKYPDRFGLIFRVPLLDPKNGELLLRNLIDNPAAKGVRLTFFRKEEATWLFDGTADWYWPVAQELGVPTMIHAAKFCPQVAEIAEKFPDLNLILDHMGVPGGTKDENCRPYVNATASLSKFENVSVKLSSLPAKSSELYPYKNLEPYVQKLIESFGPERCFWGTDLSRILGAVGGSYRDCVTHFTEEMKFLSSKEVDLIMGRSLCNKLDWSIP